VAQTGTDVEGAAQRLAAGEVVVFPTETVYGLGASVRRPRGLRRLFELKQRPAAVPLTIHVGGVGGLAAWAKDVPGWARRLVEEVWPGPVTIVVPKGTGVSALVTGGRDSVGLRAPDHPLTLQLIRRLGELESGPGGLAGPSANLHGAAPPTSLAQVDAMLMSGSAYALDGGACRVKVASTVVDCLGERPRILRPGAITAEQIASITGLGVD
jgi:L-threonylcarbamoyladenylate synthase